MNTSVRYHANKDKLGHVFPLHPLDEVQENTNQWEKRILLGPDEISWRSHSHNVAAAQMCINFEEVGFTKNKLVYGTRVRFKPHHNSTKTTTLKNL